MPQQIEVAAEELITAFQKEWPLQYEVTALRLVNAKQAAQLSAINSATTEPARLGPAEDLPAGR